VEITPGGKDGEGKTTIKSLTLGKKEGVPREQNATRAKKNDPVGQARKKSKKQIRGRTKAKKKTTCRMPAGPGVMSRERHV